jgi:ribosomal protein L11 methyltransferase
MDLVAAAHPFRILAPADAAAAAGPMDLVLDRGAFGGGTHPTTESCLELLVAIAPLTGARVLDLGSGTGILAIAALRLGAASALCVDVNPDAVATARRNAIANGIEDRLEHRCGTLDDVAGPFDLAVANIGGDLLLDRTGPLVTVARPGGKLLLSGVLDEYGDELATAYGRLGCHVLARRSRGGFCTLLLRRG